MEPEGLFPCSHDLVTGPYPEAHAFSPIHIFPFCFHKILLLPSDNKLPHFFLYDVIYEAMQSSRCKL
jgi:hypothetical protein